MTKNKEITPHIIWKALLAVFALALLALAFSGCNPVKQVLKDESKMKQVFDEGVKKSWCANDTIIQSKSDTLVTFDTLFAVDFHTDTFTVDREVTKTVTQTVTKTVRIQDTVTQVVRDNSLIELQKKEISKLSAEQSKLNKELVNMTAEKQAFKQARNKWRLYFWLIVAGITAFILRKPILFGVKRLIGIPI